MFTRNAGPKALVTLIRHIATGGLEGDTQIPLELGEYWRGGFEELGKMSIRDAILEVVDDYEATLSLRPQRVKDADHLVKRAERTPRGPSEHVSDLRFDASG